MKKLLIIFVKNTAPGKVKTRLAKAIGNDDAMNIYNELVHITEKVTSKIDIDKVLYFSESIEELHWKKTLKKVQQGENLGVRMKNAFLDGFNSGYESVVLIGSDLPDISKEIILNAFNELKNNDAVFGPAQDGGYYLIGLTKMLDTIFENKPWSQPKLLDVTLSELRKNNYRYSLLEILNDIDTFEDLINSEFYKTNQLLQEKFSHLISEKL